MVLNPEYPQYLCFAKAVKGVQEDSSPLSVDIPGTASVALSCLLPSLLAFLTSLSIPIYFSQ